MFKVHSWISQRPQWICTIGLKVQGCAYKRTLQRSLRASRLAASNHLMIVYLSRQQVLTISKLRANCSDNASSRIWKRSRSQSRSKTKTATPKAPVTIHNITISSNPQMASKAVQPLKSRNRAQTTMILAKTSTSQQSCNLKTVGRFTVQLRLPRKETTIVVPRKKAARHLEISLSGRHRATQTTKKWKRHQLQTKTWPSSSSSQ